MANNTTAKHINGNISGYLDSKNCNVDKKDEDQHC